MLVKFIWDIVYNSRVSYFETSVNNWAIEREMFFYNTLYLKMKKKSTISTLIAAAPKTDIENTAVNMK